MLGILKSFLSSRKIYSEESSTNDSEEEDKDETLPPPSPATIMFPVMTVFQLWIPPGGLPVLEYSNKFLATASKYIYNIS